MSTAFNIRRDEKRKKANPAGKYGLADHGFAIARVEYPESAGEPANPGLLVMTKGTTVKDHPAYILAYKSLDRTSSNQSTTAQQYAGS